MQVPLAFRVPSVMLGWNAPMDNCAGSAPRAVGQLCVEVWIDVAVSDAAQRGPSILAPSDPDRADTEQGLIVEDVLAAE